MTWAYKLPDVEIGALELGSGAAGGLSQGKTALKNTDRNGRKLAPLSIVKLETKSLCHAS